MRRALLILAGLLAFVAIVAVIVYVAFTGPGEIPPASRDLANLSAEERAEMAQAGEYVARTGDCVACHKSPDGLSLAGGTPMETPFGTIYGSNITPSRDHGIAGYSADDLYRVMVYGIAPGGRHLYPAMPYTSYHAISRADNDALWVWLMAQEPVERPNRPAELIFPFNMRPLLAFWNLVYRPDPPDQPVGITAPQEDQLTRGRYLVEVLGHCSECHTPRNVIGGPIRSRFLAGGPNPEGEGKVPNITPSPDGVGSWSADDIAYALDSGFTPDFDSLGGSMAAVVRNMHEIPASDREAIAAYLKSVPPLPNEN